MIKVEVSMTIYIDPLDLLSTYIDEETIREYVEVPIKDALSDVNARPIFCAVEPASPQS